MKWWHGWFLQRQHVLLWNDRPWNVKTFCTLCSHGGGHSQHIEIEEHFEVQAPTKARKCKFNNFVSVCWSFGFSFQFFDLSRLERKKDNAGPRRE
ncbi:hypothetical protein E4U35_006878 [Claviceps purpurea]|nr:hypothetical protein E4U36_000583 [Claviceps purpurea]KAG6209619.1 hypothetical protein E4U35_006878 [Claviceps purpurea]